MLKPFFSGANYKAGDVFEASWFLQANHAGGYYFRLCSADEALTEECFQRTPVPFEGSTTTVRMASGKESVVNATFLSKGTVPQGSTWKMNPVPECCASLHCPIYCVPGVGAVALLCQVKYAVLSLE